MTIPRRKRLNLVHRLTPDWLLPWILPVALLSIWQLASSWNPAYRPRNLRATMTPLIITEAKPAEPLAKGPVLRVENVSKSFGANRALHPVSLQIGRGEVVAIVGRSGSGKSTSIWRDLAYTPAVPLS